MAARRATVLKKVVAATVAVVLVVLVFVPLLREFLDGFGIDEDSIDSAVSTIIIWVLAALLAAAIYTCIVDGPRAFMRLWTRRKGVNPR
jgi:hypothetical protein